MADYYRDFILKYAHQYDIPGGMARIADSSRKWSPHPARKWHLADVQILIIALLYLRNDSRERVGANRKLLRCSDLFRPHSQPYASKYPALCYVVVHVPA